MSRSAAGVRRAAAGLALSLAVGWVGPGPAAAQTPNQPVMAVVPVRIELGSEPVTVELMVTGAPPSGGFSVDVLFDPASVVITGITLGDWPGSTGRPVQPLGPNLDHPGRATLGALMVGEDPAPAGDGVLAVFTLAGLAEGTSDITLAKAILVGSERDNTPVSALTEGAQVIVAAVPAEAAATAIAAAATLAAEPRAGLDPGFVAAVEAEATRKAPAFETAIVPAIASFTPVANDGTPEGSGQQPPLSGSGDDARPGRSLILVAVLAAAIAFLWVFARRGPSG